MRSHFPRASGAPTKIEKTVVASAKKPPAGTAASAAGKARATPKRKPAPANPPVDPKPVTASAPPQPSFSERALVLLERLVAAVEQMAPKPRKTTTRRRR